VFRAVIEGATADLTRPPASIIGALVTTRRYQVCRARDLSARSFVKLLVAREVCKWLVNALYSQDRPLTLVEWPTVAMHGSRLPEQQVFVQFERGVDFAAADVAKCAPFQSGCADTKFLQSLRSAWLWSVRVPILRHGRLR
jgi:hypothetical protein